MEKQNFSGEGNPLVYVFKLEERIEKNSKGIEALKNLYDQYLDLYNKTTSLNKFLYEKEIKDKLEQIEKDIIKLTSSIEETKKEIESIMEKMKKEN